MNVTYSVVEVSVKENYFHHLSIHNKNYSMDIILKITMESMKSMLLKHFKRKTF
jgi:hypothetical protein